MNYREMWNELKLIAEKEENEARECSSMFTASYMIFRSKMKNIENKYDWLSLEKAGY